MNKKILAAIIAIVAIGGIAWYVNTATPKIPSKDNSTEAMMKDTDNGGMMEDGTDMTMTATGTPPNGGTVVGDLIITPNVPQSSVERIFTVKGSNFAFSPTSLTVNKGDMVKIVFENSGGFHDFKIDEFSVATKKINGGESDTIEFLADKAGSFEFYCSIGSHRAMGMKGTLIVK